MTLDIRPYDAVDYLTDDETIAYYLIDALEENDANAFARALGHVARALGGIGNLAERTGLSKETLSVASGANGNPDLSTILRVLTAFNVRVSASRTENSAGPVLTAA